MKLDFLNDLRSLETETDHPGDDGKKERERRWRREQGPFDQSSLTPGPFIQSTDTPGHRQPTLFTSISFRNFLTNLLHPHCTFVSQTASALFQTEQTFHIVVMND